MDTIQLKDMLKLVRMFSTVKTKTKLEEVYSGPVKHL